MIFADHPKAYSLLCVRGHMCDCDEYPIDYMTIETKRETKKYHNRKLRDNLSNIVDQLTVYSLNKKGIHYDCEKYDAWGWEKGAYGFSAYITINNFCVRISDHYKSKSYVNINIVVDSDTLSMAEIIDKIKSELYGTLLGDILK